MDFFSITLQKPVLPAPGLAIHGVTHAQMSREQTAIFISHLAANKPLLHSTIRMLWLVATSAVGTVLFGHAESLVDGDQANAAPNVGPLLRQGKSTTDQIRLLQPYDSTEDTGKASDASSVRDTMAAEVKMELAL